MTNIKPSLHAHMHGHTYTSIRAHTHTHTHTTLTREIWRLAAHIFYLSGSCAYTCSTAAAGNHWPWAGCVKGAERKEWSGQPERKTLVPLGYSRGGSEGKRGERQEKNRRVPIPWHGILEIYNFGNTNMGMEVWKCIVCEIYGLYQTLFPRQQNSFCVV